MTFKPKDFTVWVELPVTDMEKSIAFYNEVFGTDLIRQEEGPNPIAVFPREDNGVGAHLYPGKPAVDGTGPTVHLQCPDTVEDTMMRLEKAGGKVVSPVVTIPVGRFCYCQDLDGNSLGLFTR